MMLDEAAEYLGVDDAEERAIDEAEAARAKAYAEGVLEILSARYRGRPRGVDGRRPH